MTWDEFLKVVSSLKKEFVYLISSSSFISSSTLQMKQRFFYHLEQNNRPMTLLRKASLQDSGIFPPSLFDRNEMLTCTYTHKAPPHKINHSTILFTVQRTGNEILVHEGTAQHNNHADVEIMKGTMGNLAIRTW